MSKISLRSYNRKIEGLLESGKIDGVIQNCKFILTSFPRYIDTYRLLGKAFLELKQYEYAELVFTQVLLVYPDDFISHIGISYIFETSSDFVSAVDHMEKAFELQPANLTIQDELKRLYKARDGVEPTRVRLTRGALIKMYARSNLFSQAIAEIRVALHEHANRYDLEVTLAKMLFQSGQNIEAVECCLDIISKHPFCFDANHILVQILPVTSEAKDVNIFQLKLNELDPYYKYVSIERPDVYSIPDIAVSIDEMQEIPFSATNPFDWKIFIMDSWKEKIEWVAEETRNEDVNWDEIIEKHFETEKDEKLIENIFSNDEKRQESDPETKSFSQNSPIKKIEENEFLLTEQESFSQSSISDKSESIESINPATIPEWLKIEDQIQPPQEFDQLNTYLNENEFENEESGFLDHDAPVLFDNFKEDNNPPSIWIQDTPEIDNISMNNTIKELQNTNEIMEQMLDVTKNNENVSHSDQYYEVVLKDAHDALLSGFPQRAVEGYRLLLQDNKMTELATTQLEEDLFNFPKFFDLWIILGDAYHRLGMPNKALEIFKEAEKHLSDSKGENV
jgi:tetratricopeptide (TPR) repeat protein